MKKEISITENHEKIPEQYMTACGNLSWYDFVTAMPSLVFVVTGWKSNGKENACLHSWSSFAGSGAENFICILGKVTKDGHMYQSLKETGACVLNFPSNDIYDRCVKTIYDNQFETDEITAAGLTAEKATKVNAPRIKECFLNIECEYLWEHDLYEGSREVAIALKSVNICMNSDHYDQSKLGRYGKSGYLFMVDQPTNPETGEITPFGPGILEQGNPRHMNDNNFAGVGAVVLHDNKILLVRHNSGSAAGKLLNPGGMIKHGELPTDAIKREVLEETGITINPIGMLCVRCSHKDWYMVFIAEYVSGEAKSDNDENSEAFFMDCNELLQREDATDTVKTLVRLALNKKPILAEDAGKGRVMFASNDAL